jgi:hypothetical protein
LSTMPKIKKHTPQVQNTARINYYFLYIKV